jgi:hypothetical protein
MNKVGVFDKALLACVLILCTSGMVRSQEVIHTSKNGHYTSESTELSIKPIINNPKAIVVAFPTEETKKMLPSPIGIWSNGVNWYIFRQDRQPIPDSAKFRVIYTEGATEKQFLYVVNEKTIRDNIAYLDHPTLNNNSNQQIIGIASHNPNGVYNNAFIDFAYDEKEKMWYVFNTNKKPIPKDLGIYMIITEKGVAQAPQPLPKGPAVKKVPVKGTPTARITKEVAQPTMEVIKPGALISQVMYDVDFPNWNFEDGLNGWTQSGIAFKNQPTFGDNVLTNRVLQNMNLRNS